MKTSELKHLAKSKGFRVNDDDEGNLAIVTDSTNVTELLTVWKRFAVISNNHSGVFSIYDSNQLDDELVDAIIQYARTPIEERIDKIYTAEFTEQEIKGLVDAFQTEPVKIITTPAYSYATFKFHNVKGFDAFLTKIAHLCYEAKRDEK